MSVAPSLDVEAATFGAAATGDPVDPIERDQWGRPKLPGPDGKVVGHTRASSAGKPLEDTTKLTEWKERQVTVGTLQALLAETQEKLSTLGGVEDDPNDSTEPAQQQRAEREVAIGMYAAMAKGIMLKLDEIGPEPDKDLVEESKAWKAAVNAIVEQAHAAAGSKDRADLGTYLHSVLDARFKGKPVPDIPERFTHRYTVAQRDRDVAATDAAITGWIELCRERFVVCDTWTIAGTVDSLALIPIDLMVSRASELAERTKASRMWAKNKARITAWCTRRLDAYAAWKAEGVAWVMVINDFKSGRSMDFGGLAYTAQVAAYADSVFMDPETKERSPFTSVLPQGLDPATVRIDRETSVIVHTPVGSGICRIYDVPLDEGRSAIAMACDVRAVRNDSRNWLQLVHEVEAPRPADAIEPVPSAQPGSPVDQISDQIAACHSIEELVAVRTKHLTPVDYGKPGPDGVHVPRPVVHWTPEHEALAGAKAALLKPPAPKAPEQVATESDPVMAEIERADSISVLRGVYAVHKDAWTPEYDAAAAAKAELINAAKAVSAA